MAIVPGWTSDTWMPSGASSTRSESAIASSACFDIAYAPRNGKRALTGDGADDDDAASGRPKRRQERLSDGELADDVHLELASKLCEWQVLERRRDGDTGVVDEAVETVDAFAAAAAMASASVTSSSSSSVPTQASPALRTQASTRAPRLAKWRAHASPIPVDAPVTRTVFTSIEQ